MKRTRTAKGSRVTGASASDLTQLDAPSPAQPAPSPAVIYPKLRLNKLKKFQAYLSAIKENVALREAKDIEQARILEEKMAQIQRHIFKLMTVRTIFYVLLYASVISSLVAGFSWLQYLTAGITLFSSVLGSGLLFVLILFLNHAIDSHFSDLHLMAAHLIAIYVKNEDDWRPRILEFIEQSF